MRALVVVAVFLGCFCCQAEPVRVAFACGGISEKTQACIADHLGKGFEIVVSPRAGILNARDALAMIDRLPAKGADVIVLGIGMADARGTMSFDGYRRDLEAIIRSAREREMPIIWCRYPVDGSEGGIAGREMAEGLMTRSGAVIADYAGFLTSFPETTPAGRMNEFAGEFFAEALGQWWSVLARENRRYHREKLWEDRQPPQYSDVGPMRLNSRGRVDHVSVPEITRLTATAKGNATAVIVFPGGGYSFLGFLRNARELAEILEPRGILVFGLGYRTGRGAEVPLLDAQRAVRWVRAHARELGVNPERIGVAGISAGANLALHLASRWTAGEPESSDPVERVSSRPDFVAVFSVWNFGSVESPFVFRSDTPPVFLRHARDDKGFALGARVVEQLKQANVPVDVLFLDEGGHGAFDFAPGSRGAGWPADFLTWLQKRGLWTQPPS